MDFVVKQMRVARRGTGARVRRWLADSALVTTDGTGDAHEIHVQAAAEGAAGHGHTIRTDRTICLFGGPVMVVW